MTMQPVTIGDPASLTRNIDPSDYVVGWKTTGLPGDAVALDSFTDLLEVRVRPVLTAIIQSDAPTGIRLTDFDLTGTSLQLSYDVGGHAAHLLVDLADLFASAGLPENIATSASRGTSSMFPTFDHVHSLPSRTIPGEIPLVGLDQLATAPPAGYSKRLGFDATGVPVFLDELAGFPLSDMNPVDVGAAGAPTPGTSGEASRQTHGHGIAARSVGFTELLSAPTTTDYGRALGFDATTGEPTAIDVGAGGGTFLSQTDTPGTFGSAGQVPQVNVAQDALEFGGPYQPLPTPADPTSLRATDAFDMALEVGWNAVTGAEAYEWQRRVSGAVWPAGNGTRTTQTSTRNASPLALVSYDFRARSVGQGGLLRSGWTELLNIPVIATPTPGTSANNVLTRVRSQTLRYVWDNLDVNNGGSGQARVVKAARYEYQYRVENAPDWGSLVAHATATAAQVSGLVDGTMYEMRVQGVVQRSDGTGTDVTGLWSAASNAEKPVKQTATLTYGVAPTRTGIISSPRTVEIPLTGSITFEITNALNPVADGEFYALDLARGDEYDRAYNLSVLETRPLATDITAGSNYMVEVEPASGPRRYSVGPSTAITQTQIWYIEVA